MLPPPTLSFTIPSIQDDTVLQCRVYHPSCLAPTSVSQIIDWKKKAAIVAHPYAPLGGCYDDPVVDAIAATILKQGWVVATFNFRGAGSSQGRTSWQSKPEQNDYISILGFIVYYLHLLSPPEAPPKFTLSDPGRHDLTPVPSQALPPPTTLQLEQDNEQDTRPRLLLAGYSYGALITCSLPAILSSIIAPFQDPPPRSAHAEIRLRAERLAGQQNEIMQQNLVSLFQYNEHRRGRSLQANDVLHSPKVRGGVRMGGDEDPRRASHESYRPGNSFAIETPELVKKSVDRVRSITRHKKFSPKRHASQGSFSSYKNKKRESSSTIDKKHSDEEEEAKKKQMIQPIPGITLKVGYLLVSPLQGWVNTLATMWSATLAGRDTISENEMKLAIDPTLALFGDGDVFVSVKRLHAWAEKLASAGKGGGSQFRYRKVANAGHFWHDHEAVKVLQDEIKFFVSTL
ncbi:hypothetical protein LHYA1_G009183 [Lachnellula hyalina]|uniref:AB hydrolase-1 domain-containing protein n=1 Tax=Lachnellula hyalina TaxID=1316788 RepID=A0A8H8QUB1_9HELO|nr:uncharacterized protein LHYA1_G009183 [Lachnellula hyalina]TVY22266.1 hypothetical protein LHYA1_G009183 [Lachnellula hyalina]